MQCPACPTETLDMTDRQGIEIDYCPKCRGVWLDRGELDKLIERSAAQGGEGPVPDPGGVRPLVQSKSNSSPSRPFFFLCG